jgi:5-methylcytosine-specific restriction endonuclease McrBC GTP-binding regulatory subunit McrB
LISRKNSVQNASSTTSFFDIKNNLPKPFLILAGISGTGKTRFVRAQAARSNGWPADDPRKPDNYELVAVRPDWHEPSDLLGYVSRINGEKYIPTPFLKFLIKAWREVFNHNGSLTDAGEGTRPFWLCLDEMNLAPVEQYFADYLSILESRKWTENGYSSLPIISDDLELVMKSLGGSEDDPLWKSFIDNGGIPLPPNLIVAGTVNMDETAHGFSRKVIDRALTLDFQEFFPNRYEEFFDPETEPKLLSFSTASQVGSADELSRAAADPDGKKSIEFISAVNKILKSTPFELAYRALNELLLAVKCFSPDNDRMLAAVWDDFLMQKVLPRIEGDAEKLRYTDGEESGLLNELKELINSSFAEYLENENGILKRPDLLNQKIGGSEAPACSCKSIGKIAWMQKRLEQNQYTSFWA